ncbi:MAG: TetR/AcrR family transcriptional regulator [Deltaproteobacteria bacterium]|nr:TetR/AcrR family transcriptional regulator [Deltaproteobacteria bacterium]
MEKTSQHPRTRRSSRAPRRAHILDVAAKVLAERGYRDTTMLEVARRSNASKETLYAWFGDKLGLFEAVIRRNSGRIRLALNGRLDGDTSVESALTEFGRALAFHLLCDNAVSINRAAISEARSGPSLAGRVAKSGREPIQRRFARYLQQCHERGVLFVEDPDEAVETFVGLLFGSAQTLRLLGVIDAPGESEIEHRAAQAVEKFLRLYGT